MWTKMALIVGALATWTGCGIDDLGVRSVTFGLHPAAIPEPPEGLDGATLAALGSASGTVNADVLADDGHIMISGAPTLPEGFSYRAMGEFAEDARAEIPGDESGDGHGHTHGPLSAEAPTSWAAAELTVVALGALEAGDEVGHWEVEFSQDDLGASQLGAIRSAMVMVVPDAGAAVPVLAGEVGEDAEGAAETGEEGGHSHGP